MTDFSLSLDNVTENMFDHYKVRMRTEEAMEACPFELSGILREDCQRSLYYGMYWCIGILFGLSILHPTNAMNAMQSIIFSSRACPIPYGYFWPNCCTLTLFIQPVSQQNFSKYLQTRIVNLQHLGPIFHRPFN